MQLDQEPLAVDNNPDPIAQAFSQTWSPCGMDTATHFIIIFTNLSTSLTPNTSHHTSPFSHLVQSTRPISGSCHSSVGFQAPLPIGTSLDGLGNLSADVSRTGSPIFGMGVNQQLSDNISVSQLPSSPNSQDGIAPHLVPGTKIKTVCHLHGITDDALQAAKYKSAEKTLLGMVLSH